MDKKEKIIQLTKEYIDGLKVKKFIGGETYIPPSGQVFDGNDVSAVVGNALEQWYAEGKHSHEFERRLIERFKYTIRDVILCNRCHAKHLHQTDYPTDERGQPLWFCLQQLHFR